MPAPTLPTYWWHTQKLEACVATFTELAAQPEFAGGAAEALLADAKQYEAELADRQRNGVPPITLTAAINITKHRTKHASFPGHVNPNGDIWWGSDFMGVVPRTVNGVLHHSRDRFGNYLLTVDDLHHMYDQYEDEVLLPRAERYANEAR